MHVVFIAIIVILVLTGFILAIYFVIKNKSTGFNIRVVQIPTGTALSSINDVAQVCNQGGYRLATADDIRNVMSRIGYTYCTRGYINDATIIPVSPTAPFPGCPSSPGLHLMDSIFPCLQRATTEVKCEEVAFCIEKTK